MWRGWRAWDFDVVFLDRGFSIVFASFWIARGHHTRVSVTAGEMKHNQGDKQTKP